MPTGKVKWYDAEKGFGFLSREDGDDVYVNAAALPDGTETLKNGARVEFGIAQGRRGDQALQVKVLEQGSVEANQRQGRGAQRGGQRAGQRGAQRKKPEDMVGIVEDLINLLEGVSETYRAGRRPDHRTAAPTAKLLRALADELD